MKGKLTFLIVVVITLATVALAWYYLQSFMEEHDIEEKTNGTVENLI